MASRRPVTIEVPVSPNPRSALRKSAAVSPTVVHSTLISQNQTVTSGTLLSNVRDVVAACWGAMAAKHANRR